MHLENIIWLFPVFPSSTLATIRRNLINGASMSPSEVGRALNIPKTGPTKDFVFPLESRLYTNASTTFAKGRSFTLQHQSYQIHSTRHDCQKALAGIIHEIVGAVFSITASQTLSPGEWSTKIEICKKDHSLFKLHASHMPSFQTYSSHPINPTRTSLSFQTTPCHNHLPQMISVRCPYNRTNQPTNQRYQICLLACHDGTKPRCRYRWYGSDGTTEIEKSLVLHHNSAFYTVFSDIDHVVFRVFFAFFSRFLAVSATQSLQFHQESELA
jgi:hypothetical protein